MKKLMIAVAAVSALTGFAEVEINEGVLEVSVASGTQDGYTEDQLTAINGGTVTEIKKTGAGTLVSKGIAGYPGKITVAGGILKVTDKTGLGNSTGATWVESSATLEFNAASAGDINDHYASEEFHLAGTGTDGNGAVNITTFAVQFGKLVLEDDASVNAQKDSFKTTSWYSYGGYWDFKGHTLTVNAPATGNIDLNLATPEVRSVGTIVANNARYVGVTSDLKGKGRIVLKGRCGIRCDSSDMTNRKIEWDLEFASGCTGGGWIYTAPFVWDGDWYINTASILNLDPCKYVNSVLVGGEIVLNGNLRGTGSLQKGNNDGTIYLCGTNNDCTGTLYVKGGRFVVTKKAGQLKNPASQINFNNADGAMFAVGAKTDSNPDGFTAAEIQDFFVTMTNTTTGVKGIYVPDGDTFTGSITFDSANTASLDYRFCDASKFGTCGGGTCVLTGPFVNRPSLKIYTSGDLRFSNPSEDPDRVNELGNCWVVGGTVTFEDAGTLDFGNKSIYSSGSTGSTMPNVVYKGNTRVVKATTYTPKDANNQNGRTVFGAGSVVTNNLFISTDGAMDSGSAVVNGGDVTIPTGADSYVGSWGQGAMIVESGSLTVNKHVLLGVQPPAIGQIFVHGGTYDSVQTAHIGYAGTSVVYQTAGTIKASSLVMGESSGTAEKRPHSAVTIDGGAFVSSADAKMANSAYTVSMLNLNGGSFQARRIYSTQAANAWADLAFNGGTLKAAPTSDGWELLYGTNLIATVYAAGAVVDTAGCNCRLGRPLVAATGKGVSAIAMSQASYTGFAAPPVVTIVGDGRGASAVPVYDSLSGTVTGIRVTSPGYGYTTATATMFRGNSDYYTAKKPIELTVALADNTAPVKLVKRGEGTLTVGADELPADAVVSVEGGSLAGEGVTFAEYSADIAAGGVYGKIPSWPDGAVLSIANMDQLNPGTTYTLVEFGTAPAAVPALKAGCVLPEGWKLKLVGKQLVLFKLRGTVLLVH